jgi:hypothetical protein
VLALQNEEGMRVKISERSRHYEWWQYGSAFRGYYTDAARWHNVKALWPLPWLMAAPLLTYWSHEDEVVR